ncbi:MAG: hypothetical protein KJ000_26070 [Pirellulaceae bacterium]|nr:hypothetical protein [Pirellulaceae bacterium]
MESRLQLDILAQPDNVTCGPTCLHAVYRFYGEEVPLENVIRETPQLREGGTLAVLLGCHALRRGYDATILTCNLQIFDPTWFQPPFPALADRLRAQMAFKPSQKLRVASEAYLELLELGGRIQMEDFTSKLIRRFLKREIPILTGLSATNLYRAAREFGPNCEADDVRGEPVGHFVVLCGYNLVDQSVLVADPFRANPLGPGHKYHVSIDHVLRSIMLGILTYDANLLIIQPRKARRGGVPENNFKQEGVGGGPDRR